MAANSAQTVCYRMVTPKIVFLVFVSGKCVITGAKTRQQMHEAFNNMYAVLMRFKTCQTNKFNDMTRSFSSWLMKISQQAEVLAFKIQIFLQVTEF